MRQPRIFHLLQRAHSALFRASDSSLKKHVGLSTAQQTILFALTIKDGIPITAIADQLRMGKSSLTGLIDRMEANDLVRRSPSDADGRSLKVFIEDRGRKLVQETLPVTKKINTALLEPFSRDELLVIEKFLNHIADNGADIVALQAEKTFKEKITND